MQAVRIVLEKICFFILIAGKWVVIRHYCLIILTKFLTLRKNGLEQRKWSLTEIVVLKDVAQISKPSKQSYETSAPTKWPLYLLLLLWSPSITDDDDFLFSVEDTT